MRKETCLLIRISTGCAIGLASALTAFAPLASAQTTSPEQPPSEGGASIAAEADILSFFIGGYSGILNLSLPNGFQVAFGLGRYDVPSFILEGDSNFDEADWEATATFVQVLRSTYRFNGPMKNGPAVGVVLLNQDWELRSEPLDGETSFKYFSVGLTGGYYFHIGKHFYIYPTAAYTYNDVYSGETSVAGTDYEVEEFGPNASVHVGWEWEL
jgi:hypothetical protein